MDRRELAGFLETLQEELREAREVAAAAQRRVARLAQTVDGLRGLIAMEPALPLLEMEPATETKSEVKIVSSGGSARDVGLDGAIQQADEPERLVRPREAILRLLGEAPPSEWSVQEIEAEMRKRGWLDPGLKRPSEAIRAAANRLVDVDDLVLRTGVSSYRLPTSTDPLTDPFQADTKEVS